MVTQLINTHHGTTLSVCLQVIMVTVVGWELGATGTLGDLPQQVFLRVVLHTPYPRIFRPACFSVGCRLLHRGGCSCSGQDASQPGGTETGRRCEEPPGPGRGWKGPGAGDWSWNRLRLKPEASRDDSSRTARHQQQHLQPLPRPPSRSGQAEPVLD